MRPPTGALRARAASLLAATLALAVPAGAAGPAKSAALPPIRHVFIVVLENKGYEESFGEASRALYLKSLRRQGASVPNYYGTSHFSLGNYVSMISGQAPNPATNMDCEVYSEFIGTGTTADGQAIGQGCVYPANIRTIANQLERAHLRWKAYMEDMGNDPRRESATCGHPPVGAADNTQGAAVGDQYAARHDPFVYFHAIIDAPSCAASVVNLAALERDLRSVATTPNYAFITPNLCHDGHDGGGSARCVDGQPGGLVSADEFLRQWVPRITASPAFRRDGLLVITFDESDIADDYEHLGSSAGAAGGVAAACCNEQPGPNIAPYHPGPGYRSPSGMNGPGLVGPGGGRIGAVLLSPFIKPGTATTVSYNHYSLLRSVEDLFGLPHLGFAAQPGLQAFGADVYTRWPASPAPR
ncbi:MAG TPA: alkaline phosphatase family protein [Burkholderiaceae bacterium]|nr:alkaline phosphatase family protein [Burkholderiaceae bacterium]